MKKKLKVCLVLLVSFIVLASISSNAISKKINTNKTVTITDKDGKQITTDLYSFTEPYDETAITEDHTIKIGEGYTSDGIYYEAFKPATE